MPKIINEQISSEFITKVDKLEEFLVKEGIIIEVANNRLFLSIGDREVIVGGEVLPRRFEENKLIVSKNYCVDES